MVSNDTISAVLKFNKRETCQQKITTPLTNKGRELMDNYFYTHISYLLGFYIDDIVLFDTKYFPPN